MSSKAFTKLFASITDSSIWGEDDATRIIWITMLAMSDSHGYVGASIPGLAARARKSVVEVEAALERFMSPDPYSRTPDYDGRRIVNVDGGWLLLNYEKHRAVVNIEAARASKRAWAAKARSEARQASGVDAKSRESLSTVDENRKSRISASASVSSTSGSDLDPEGVQGEPKLAPGVFDAPTIVVDRNRGRTAPADFEPTDAHRVRCQELKLDVNALLRDFKAFEFNREYSDWPKRFSRWIEDQRTRAETDRAKALSGAGKAPRSAFQRSGLPGLETSDGHARFAAKHGLDLGAIVGDLVREGVVDALGAKGAREELERRLSAAARSKARGAA